MKLSEFQNESMDQEAGIGHKGINLKFKVKDLIFLAKKYPTKAIDPTIFKKQIAGREEDKTQSDARAAKADLQWPIIVVDFGDNDFLVKFETLLIFHQF